MKRIMLFCIALLAVLGLAFAQIPSTDIDTKVFWNNAFRGVSSLSLDPAATKTYRIKCTERAFFNIMLTCPSNAWLDAVLIPSYWPNSATTNMSNYSAASNYFSYTNAPQATIDVMNPNEAQFINQYHSITIVTQAYSVNTTNMIMYPCRSTQKEAVFTFPAYLPNTKTYMLMISNSTATTNVYQLEFLLWKP